MMKIVIKQFCIICQFFFTESWKKEMWERDTQSSQKYHKTIDDNKIKNLLLTNLSKDTTYRNLNARDESA